MSMIGALMPGVPTQASSPAAGQRAANPAAAQRSTRARNAGSRALMYCAP